MSEIKIKRALALASIGSYPQSAAAMFSAIPARIIAALSSREIVAEGMVWDARRNHHRAIEV